MTTHRHQASGKWTTSVTDPDLAPYAKGTDLSALQARVIALEGKVATLEARVTALETTAPGVRSTFTTA